MTLSYFAFDEGPISKASGFSKAFFQLRDPAGKVYGYIVNCPHQGQPEFTGIESRCPPWPYETAGGDPGTLGGIKRVYFNRVFKCPESAAAPCDALTPVQYQARVLLPVGSVAGTWGLVGMTVYDKAENFRSYDFTELFRFVPLSSSAPAMMSAFGDSSSGNHLTFEVSGVGPVGSKEPSISTVVISSAWDALSAVTSTVSNWASKAASWITSGVTRVATWVQGGVQSGLHVSRAELGFEGNDAVTMNRKGEASRSSNSATAEGDVISIAEDPLTGSRYQILREEKLGSDRQQGWKLEYRSSTDMLFASKTLPDTSEVLWKAPRSPNALPTTAWTQVCSDRVWSAQDGYQMLFHVGDRALSDLRSGQLWVNSQTEVTVIEDMRCAFGGAIWVEGYAFGANDREPLLRGERITASRFGFALDRFGAISKREVTTANFEVPKFCAEPANEQLMFCAAAKKAVGW